MRVGAILAVVGALLILVGALLFSALAALVDSVPGVSLAALLGFGAVVGLVAIAAKSAGRRGHGHGKGYGLHWTKCK